MRKLIYLLLLLSLSLGVTAQQSKTTRQTSSLCRMFQGHGAPYGQQPVRNWVNHQCGYQLFYWDMESVENGALYVYDRGSSDWIRVGCSGNGGSAYMPPYKSYVAKLYKTGNNQFQVTEVFNNTGINFTFSIINSGFYAVNFSQSLPADKVAMLIDHANATFMKSYNSMNITFNRADQPYVESDFLNDVIEIRIYN